MAHISATETTLSKAGRLAALAALDKTVNLEDYTLQELANALGVGHRSTICRDLKLLPAVRAAHAEAEQHLKHLKRRST